jgi:hypothetical protein
MFLALPGVTGADVMLRLVKSRRSPVRKILFIILMVLLVRRKFREIMAIDFLFSLLGVSNFTETEHKRNVSQLAGVEKKGKQHEIF